ncbi:MAG: phosphate ABC transporter permease subunit PstC, partial [Candidatus Villigracilaceae bacterium]
MQESKLITDAVLLRGRADHDRREKIIRAVLLLFSIVSIFTTLGIIAVLLQETVLFFQEVSIVEFFTETRWTPLFASKKFGVLPLVNGTILVAFGSMLIALPLGLLAAIYLSEYA